MSLLALVRDPSPHIGRCELTHLTREPIDWARACAQHELYLAALQRCGCRVERLPPLPEHPDGVFVEDTAVVLDELAVIARPGAASRREETPSVRRALSRYRPVHDITPPATLDGGDVLRAGRTLFVGQTLRTNPAGAEQLAALVAGAGYVVRTVPVTGCLHLKSAVTEIADRTLLLNPAWVAPADFPGYTILECDPEESHAANALRIGSSIIHPLEFPRTGARLEAAGLRRIPVPAGELAKAEGGVTCGSLLIAE